MVTEAQARVVAENISLSLGVSTQRLHNQQTGDTQRVFQGRQRILNLTTVPAADKLPGFFICNYAQGGFALIAAGRHMQPVLAFAAHGSLPTKDLRNTQLMLEGLITWLETTKLIAAALRQNPGEKNVAPGASDGWVALGSPTPAPYRVAPIDDNPPPSSSTQRGPLLLTTWNQGCGYNDLVDNSSKWDYCYHCPTGCVATAMAQVMNYWHYPAAFNWAGMQNDRGTPATAALMKACGEAVHTDYKEGASSADDDYIDDNLKGQYGYRSAEFISNEDPGLFHNIISNLNAAQPVILGGCTSTNWFGVQNGAGHCWVCDGYIQLRWSGKTGQNWVVISQSHGKSSSLETAAL